MSTSRRYKAEGINSNINLYVANALDTGIYQLNQHVAMAFPITSTSKGVGVFKVSDDYTYPYETNPTYTGQVKITKYDVSNKIYSGTFYFTAQNINDNALVHVTDGRFDIKLP